MALEAWLSYYYYLEPDGWRHRGQEDWEDRELELLSDLHGEKRSERHHFRHQCEPLLASKLLLVPSCEEAGEVVVHAAAGHADKRRVEKGGEDSGW